MQARSKDGAVGAAAEDVDRRVARLFEAWAIEVCESIRGLRVDMDAQKGRSSHDVFCLWVTQKLGADNESDLVDIACDAEMRTLLVDRCDKLGRVTHSRMS